MKHVYASLLLGILHVSLSLAQGPAFFEKSFTEKTTDQEKFIMYIDSANKYLYRDIQIAEAALGECQKLIDQGTELADSAVFEFMLEKVYFNHSMAEPLEAYIMLTKCERLLDSIQVPLNLSRTFHYIKSFTYMAIGDLATAQKTYYENLEFAEATKDSILAINTLFSLGQLYNDENNLDAAIANFLKALKMSKHNRQRPSTLALIYLELGETYVKQERYDEAAEALEKGLKITEKENLQILASDILIEIGSIYLLKHEIDSAKQVYTRLRKMNEGSQDQNTLSHTQAFLAQLYRAEGMQTKALEIYKQLVQYYTTNEIDKLLDTYQQAHETCKEMGNFQSAYDYLLSFNELKEQRDEDEEKQETEYLKIKFDSEQKEQENTLLTAEILQNQTESKLLYSWMILSFLVLFILFGAFYQKGKYSKRLESEVLHRTLNLRKANELLNKSNEELQEFNRILSHDLKEPLRSIVGFSQLASKKLINNQKVQDYLGFVIKSGEQLQHLIESINVFHKADEIDIKHMTIIDMEELLEDTVQRVQKNIPGKEINVQHTVQVPLFSSRESLRAVFEILIENAATYNEKDLVSIHIHYYAENKVNYFEIVDNGIGIDKKYHDRIFEMFKRLNNRNKYKGSGMGLSIARKLMERIGGEITLQRSVVNEGSTFLISFPESTEVEVQRAAYQQIS